MPSKKKKYNARFPAGRIKKIMQTDEEVGKVAQAVPVIISRTLELFVESLLTKAMQITSAKNAKTLSPSHMKQCILSESRFDFLKDLVKSLPDASSCDSEEGVSSNVSSPQPYGGPSNSIDSISNRRPSEGLPTYPSWTLPGNMNTVESPVSSPTTQLHPNFYKENCEANTSFTQISPEFMPRSTVLCSNSPSIPQTEGNRSLLHHHTPSVIQTVSVLKKVEKETYSTDNIPSNTHVSSIQTISEDREPNSSNLHSPLIIPQYVKTDNSIAVDEDYDT